VCLLETNLLIIAMKPIILQKWNIFTNTDTLGIPIRIIYKLSNNFFYSFWNLFTSTSQIQF
jgi:hypothetical protein